jgi:hypothetical protein
VRNFPFTIFKDIHKTVAGLDLGTPGAHGELIDTSILGPVVCCCILVQNLANKDNVLQETFINTSYWQGQCGKKTLYFLLNTWLVFAPGTTFLDDSFRCSCDSDNRILFENQQQTIESPFMPSNGMARAFGHPCHTALHSMMELLAWQSD